MKNIMKLSITCVCVIALSLTSIAFAAESKMEVFNELTGGLLKTYISSDRITEADIEEMIQYSDIRMNLDGITVDVEGTMYDGMNSYILFRLTPDANQTIMMDYACEPEDPVPFDDNDAIEDATGGLMNFRDFQADRGGSLLRVYLTVQMDVSKDMSFNYSETNYHDGSVIVRVATEQTRPDSAGRIFTIRLQISDCDDAQERVDEMIAELAVPVTTALTTLKSAPLEVEDVVYEAVCYSSSLNGSGYITFDLSRLDSDAKQRMADSFFTDDVIRLAAEKTSVDGLWFLDGNGEYVYDASQADSMVFSFRYVSGDEDLKVVEYSNGYMPHVIIPLMRIESTD